MLTEICFMKNNGFPKQILVKRMALFIFLLVSLMFGLVEAAGVSSLFLHSTCCSITWP